MSSTITALTSGGGLAMAGDTSGQLELKTNNGTTAVTVDTSQNVGIGATPTSKLQVLAGAYTGFTLQNAGGSGIKLYTDSTAANGDFITNYYGGSGSTNGTAYIVQQNGTERMRIDSSGNIYVANTNTQIGGDTARFTISGAHNSGYFGIAVNSTTSVGNQNFINFGRAGSQCGYIYSGGTNSTSYLTSSDYRLKENIAPMTGALAKVNALKPVTYKWKQDGTSSQGFIAHELAEICPEAVGGEKDAVDAEGNPQYQGIDTSFLVATLTAAIKELNAKVDAQALEIQALKGVA
jgi:hypothetical protein